MITFGVKTEDGDFAIFHFISMNRMSRRIKPVSNKKLRHTREGEIMNKIIRVLETVFNVAGQASGLVLIAVMFLIMFEVITRYVLPHPFTISEEYSAYALVGITFLGLSYTLNKGGHLRITFAVNLMPARIANWLRVFTLSIALIWTGVATVVSVQFVNDSFVRGMRAITPQLTPLGYPRIVIPVGFFLFFLGLAAELFKTIRSTKAGLSVENHAKKKAEGDNL
jgi:TRAP-type C4-dicarboxylate transport system permease small subunit